MKSLQMNQTFTLLQLAPWDHPARHFQVPNAAMTKRPKHKGFWPHLPETRKTFSAMGASHGNQQKPATLLVGPGLGFQPKTPGGPTAYTWAFELKVSEQKMGYKKTPMILKFLWIQTIWFLL